MPRIHANRESVDDRFSVLGFTIRTESPLYEVAVATDPALFRADAKTRRGRRNFFSSRSQGALRARRGEAVYLLPQDVLANFIGQPKLYFGLATYREGSTSQPDYVQTPSDGNMWVGLTGLTERGLRRAVSSLSPSSYGTATGRDPSLEWGGDAIAQPARAPAASVTAPAPVVAASALDYDDGYGSFPTPEPQSTAHGEALETYVQPLEVLRSYNGDLASQVAMFVGTVAWVAGVHDTSRIPHSAICKILTFNGDTPRLAGTAFFVGRRTLLTNAHMVQGCTRIVVIPGKNGAGTDSRAEPFGRFEVTRWRAHENYSTATRGREFDMAVLCATRDAPGGRFLRPIEELTQSRPEGVAVCGYSAHSRRTDLVGQVVNAVLDPNIQHVHRGFVRDISAEVMHYDVNELAGSSGSPVYWIEGGSLPRVHVVGINAGPRDATTNSGCRLTPAKVAWIRARAAEFGETLALEYEGQTEYPAEEALAVEDDQQHGIKGAQPEDIEVNAQEAWSDALTNPSPQYPLARRFVPAAAGNFRAANRARADIQRIVIHITDGCTTGHCRTDAERARAINGTISWFQDPAARVSSHYIVGQDGEVVQMVRHEDVAYHAHTANTNSIGIEHVADSGHRGHVLTRPSRLQLEASAALVTWLCERFGIAKDRAHILGHSEVDSGTTHADCPNAVWDWPLYMRMVTTGQCLAQGLEGGPGNADSVFAPAPAPVMQQPLGLESLGAEPQAGSHTIASTVPGTTMLRVSLRHPQGECQLDQMRGYKHPGNQAPNAPAPFQDATPIRLTDWPRIENASREAVCMALEVRWQHNGTSLGNVQVNHLANHEAKGWRLRVTARVFDDATVYPSERPTFAALRLRLEYCFSPAQGADVHAFQELHLFGNGRYNLGGDWAQYHALPLEMDGGVEQVEERLAQATPAVSVAESLEVAARTVAATPPSAHLQAALNATTGVRKAVLTAAARELGVREERNTASTGDRTINSDPEGRIVAYLQECGITAAAGRHNSAYCAAFTTFALRAGGYAGVRGSAGASALRGQFEQAGRYRAVDQTRPYDPSRDFRPRPGDVFFTGTAGRESHAGLVVSVDDNGTLHTLEGNTWARAETNSGVMERDHAAARSGRRYALVGFGSLLDDAPRALALDGNDYESYALQTSTASLSWESTRHPERANWSRELMASVTAHKAQLDQGNPEGYLAGYNALPPERQIKFWCELLIAMAQFESSWNPRSRYQEANGHFSVGLFQLSYSNSQDYRWEAISEARASLEDPLVNIRCAVIVLSHLVAQNHVVAASEGTRHQGGARYWAVLRGGARHKFNEIREYVRTHVPMP